MTIQSLSERNGRPSWKPRSMRFVTSEDSPVRRYSGTSEKAAFSRAGSRTKSTEQATGVNSHLWGLTTSESARSIPFMRARCSGQRAATPA